MATPADTVTLKRAAVALSANPALGAEGVFLVDQLTGNAPGVRTTSNVTISNGASVSAAVALTGVALLGLLMPASWTAAALTIEVSPDAGTTWYGLVYDSEGNQCNVVASPTAGSAYAVSLAGMLPYMTIRFRSGTPATPVNQGADRAITYVTRPIA